MRSRKNNRILWKMITVVFIIIVWNNWDNIKNIMYSYGYKATGNVSVEYLESKELEKTVETANQGLSGAIATYEEQLKNTPSDLEGKSQYEKFEMGLEIEDGSDTDGDGLTDKEEIEVYGTDPLLKSTAGDLYSDKYKIENGLDAPKKLEGSEYNSFKENHCNNIILEASDINDFDAYVYDATGYHMMKSIDIYAEYKVSNFSGAMTIDLRSVLSDGITTKDIDIIIIDEFSTDFEKLSFSKDSETQITIKKGLDSADSYYIVVTEEIPMTATLLGSAEVLIASTVRNSGVQYLVSTSSFLGQWFKLTTIHIEEQSNNVATQAVVEELEEYLAANYPDVKYEIKSHETLAFRGWYGFFQKIFPSLERKENTSLFWRAAYCYYLTDDINDILLSSDLADEYRDLGKSGELEDYEHGKTSEDDKYDNLYSYSEPESGLGAIYDTEDFVEAEIAARASNTGFEMGVDSFSFYNFGSYVSPGGNCAGLAQITAEVFNNGYIAAEGAYELKNAFNVTQATYSWNLNGYEDASTLFDRGVGDYKEEWYYYLKYNLLSYPYIYEASLQGEDKEFVSLVGAKWAQMNHSAEQSVRKYTGHYYDFSLIEKMMAKLDEGKILQVHMYDNFDGLNASKGHAINVYDYWVDINDQNAIYFKVYDNAFPENSFYESKNYTAGDFVLCVTRLADNEFSYSYRPFINTSVKSATIKYYGFGSSVAGKQKDGLLTWYALDVYYPAADGSPIHLN